MLGGEREAELQHGNKGDGGEHPSRAELAREGFPGLRGEVEKLCAQAGHVWLGPERHTHRAADDVFIRVGGLRASVEPNEAQPGPQGLGAKPGAPVVAEIVSASAAATSWFPLQLGDPARELAARPQEPHPDDLLPQADQLGDLLATQALDLEKDQHAAVVGAQAIEHAVDAAPGLAAVEGFVGSGAGNRNLARGIAGRSCELAPAAVAAAAVAHHVLGDAEEPGGEPGVSPKLLEPAGDHHEHFLNEVLDVDAGPPEARRPVGHQFPVVMVELLQPIAIGGYPCAGGRGSATAGWNGSDEWGYLEL